MLPTALLLLVHVVMYLHTYLVYYVTAVCMIACLSIVRSKLSDLYEWLH